MNETPIRLAYDEWRRHNRIRHSDNLWEAFAAGADAARIPDMAGFDDLPPNKQQWVLSTLRFAIETAGET
jgi:hypothetical protein